MKVDALQRVLEQVVVLQRDVVPASRDELQGLLTEISTLTKELSKAQAELVESREKIAEAAQARCDYPDEHGGKLREQRIEIERLEAELDKLVEYFRLEDSNAGRRGDDTERSPIDSALYEMREARKRISELQAALDHADRRGLLDKLREANERAKVLEADLETATDELTRFGKAAREREQRIAELEENIVQIRESCASQRDRVEGERDGVEEELKELQKKIAALESRPPLAEAIRRFSESTSGNIDRYWTVWNGNVFLMEDPKHIDHHDDGDQQDPERAAALLEPALAAGRRGDDAERPPLAEALEVVAKAFFPTEWTVELGHIIDSVQLHGDVGDHLASFAEASALLEPGPMAESKADNEGEPDWPKSAIVYLGKIEGREFRVSDGNVLTRDDPSLSWYYLSWYINPANAVNPEKAARIRQNVRQRARELGYWKPKQAAPAAEPKAASEPPKESLKTQAARHGISTEVCGEEVDTLTGKPFAMEIKLAKLEDRPPMPPQFTRLQEMLYSKDDLDMLVIAFAVDVIGRALFAEPKEPATADSSHESTGVVPASLLHALERRLDEMETKLATLEAKPPMPKAMAEYLCRIDSDARAGIPITNAQKAICSMRALFAEPKETGK